MRLQLSHRSKIYALRSETFDARNALQFFRADAWRFENMQRHCESLGGFGNVIPDRRLGEIDVLLCES